MVFRFQVYFPVATEIWANNWNDYPVEDPLEYTHSRYTPVVTTDCREFSFDGYTLRVTEMGRKISMLVCITLYNEGQEELDRSLLGVCEVNVDGPAIESISEINSVSRSSICETVL